MFWNIMFELEELEAPTIINWPCPNCYFIVRLLNVFVWSAFLPINKCLFVLKKNIFNCSVWSADIACHTRKHAFELCKGLELHFGAKE